MDKAGSAEEKPDDKSDDEVFFTTKTKANLATSTPAVRKSKKRKRATTVSPRKTRLRSRMSGGEEDMEATNNSTNTGEESVSMETLLSNMAKQMEQLNKN